MTAGQLIEMLQKCDPRDEVEAYDPEGEDWWPVTGMTYGGDVRTVRLYTDEP